MSLNPVVIAAIARVTGASPQVIEATTPDYDMPYVEFVRELMPCINPGCNQPRSNFSDECFECRFEPFGTEWQREQEQR